MQHMIIGTGLLVVALGSNMALAQIHSSQIEVPVVGVEPIVRTVKHKIPHEQCWDEKVKIVSRGGYQSRTPSLLGAIVGGTVLGALGDNSGYQGAYAGAGALLGGSIGRDVSHSNSGRSRYVTEERCEVEYEVREEEKVVGYRVSYSYGDTIYQTRMDSHPGNTIKLRVEVKPVG